MRPHGPPIGVCSLAISGAVVLPQVLAFYVRPKSQSGEDVGYMFGIDGGGFDRWKGFRGSDIVEF